MAKFFPLLSPSRSASLSIRFRVRAHFLGCFFFLPSSSFFASFTHSKFELGNHRQTNGEKVAEQEKMEPACSVLLASCPPPICNPRWGNFPSAGAESSAALRTTRFEGDTFVAPGLVQSSRPARTTLVQDDAKGEMNSSSSHFCLRVHDFAIWGRQILLKFFTEKRLRPFTFRTSYEGIYHCFPSQTLVDDHFEFIFGVYS